MKSDFLLESHVPIDRRIAPKVRKKTGAHYTPEALATYVAKQIADCYKSGDQTTIRILDPAVGDGELLLALTRALKSTTRNAIEVCGFDTDASAVSTASQRVRAEFQNGLEIKQEDFVAFSLAYHHEGSLFPLPKFDVVIANPPYVRTQVLGAANAQELATSFGLSGRVDLYHVFICGIAAVLKPGGVAGIIVSNRFMTTRGGAEIRRILEREFEILHVWDLGDTQIFEAAVLPAVLLLRKKLALDVECETKFTSIYVSNGGISLPDNEEIISALDKLGTITARSGQSYLVQQGVLNIDRNSGGIWRISTQESDNWLQTVERHTVCTFGDIGRIRVGVKTTADKVFIHSNWTDLPSSEQPELLKPLITHHVARSYKSHPITTSILYPHEVRNGKRVAVDLSLFPIARRYLERHRSILEAREYVIASGRKWYEIWVPQDPDSWVKPKLVFRDITSSPAFWIDLSGAIVNGDCYWLTNDFDKDEDVLWLALAVGNSSFIEQFYDKSFNNKLYSGRRRFMTQYVEKFPVPSPHSKISRQIIDHTKFLYSEISSQESEKIEKEIDQLVWKSFGFGREEAAT
jgi:adenine-specific DNA-methyltransferase